MLRMLRWFLPSRTHGEEIPSRTAKIKYLGTVTLSLLPSWQKISKLTYDVATCHVYARSPLVVVLIFCGILYTTVGNTTT
jgi:hypothetical protein